MSIPILESEDDECMKRWHEQTIKRTYKSTKSQRSPLKKKLPHQNSYKYLYN